VLTDNLKYENSKKEHEEKKLSKEMENFKRELEFLKSPSRIEKEALRFGMKYPENWQIKTIKLKKNGS
jgi:cell division protein FtsL